MSARWYFSDDGRTFGPVFPGEINALVSNGKLSPRTRAWPEGVSEPLVIGEFVKLYRAGTLNQWLEQARRAARPAAAPPSASMPSWLADVPAPAAKKPPAQAPAAPMDWLDDVRQTEGQRHPAPAKPTPPAPPRLTAPPAPPRSAATPMPRPAPPPDIPVDWLQDIREIEDSLRRAPAAPPRPVPSRTTPMPQVPPTGQPTILPAIPAAPSALPAGGLPIAEAVPVTPARPAPAAPPAVKTPPPAAPPAVKTPPPAAPPAVKTPPSVAPPVVKPPVLPAPTSIPAAAAPAPPAGKAPVPPAPVPPPAKAPAPPVAAAPAPVVAAPPPPPVVAAPLPPAVPATPEVMGYNPETGQITDTAAYARWQRAEQERRAAQAQVEVAGPSIYEVFLEARRGMEGWVDAEANKPLVMTGNTAALREHPQVGKLIAAYQGYGPVMREKLWKHFDFLIENRRKFYIAFA